jgi:subfamily B ATP-binding cassette protein MsbA
MKRMLELVRPHWGRLILAGLCSVVVSGMNGSFAWVVKPAVDDIFVAGKERYLLLISIAVFLAFLLRGVAEYIQNYLMKSIGAKIVRDLRNSLYHHALYLPLARHSGDSTGSMMSRIINDASMLQALLAQSVRDLFVSAATVVVLTGIAFYRRWDLTLVALVVLPLAFYTVGRLGRILKRVSAQAHKKIATITESLSEGLSGIKIIKSFTSEEAETERFKRRNQDYYRELMRGTRLDEASKLIMDFVSGVGVAFMISYGGMLVASRAMTVGDFFSFLVAVMLIYAPAKKLAQIQNALQRADAYIGRADEVLAAEKERDGLRELDEIRRDIAYSHVSFRYQNREDNALEDVSVRVQKGEVVALVGRSGSGKTTFVDLLSRFYIPRSGEILVDGVDINTVTLKSLRSKIGIVSQDVILFNGTIRDNIAFGAPEAGEEDVLKAAKAAYAHEFITELPIGYNTPIGEGGILLSGGQRQRLSIARAILKKPSVLILDEATSSLDAQSELMVQRAIDRLMEDSASYWEKGTPTTFIIAHRLSTIKRADRIVVLDKGRVVEIGSHYELLARAGLYKRLHDLQFGDAVPKGGVFPA